MVRALGVAGDIFPSGIKVGLVFETNGGVVEGGVDDPEFGLQISFAIEIDEKFTSRFLGVDDDSHGFAGLIDQVSLSIERFDAKPEFPVAGGLELELPIGGKSGGGIDGGGLIIADGLVFADGLIFADGGPRVP